MLQILSQRHAPRFFVFLIDALICTVSVVMAYALRFEFDLQEIIRGAGFAWVIPIIVVVRGICFIIFRTYSGIIRYTTTQDAARILLATTTSSVFLFGLFYLTNRLALLGVPRSIILIDYVVTSFGLIGARIMYKGLHGLLITESRRTRVAILGLEKEVLQVKRTLDRDLGAGTQTVAIFLTNVMRPGAKLEGIPVFAAERIALIMKDISVEKLIIANELEDEQLHERTVDTCLRRQVGILSAPNIQQWLAGKTAFQRVKPYDVNDLLTRPPIKLSTATIEESLTGKRILVTGAAGSIGSEIVRQISRFAPQLIILYDQAETPLYNLDLELREKMGFMDFCIMIGSITDYHRLQHIYSEYLPEVVFHAAAYKHVPMMEEHPYEAIANNVCGTKMLTDLAVKHGVQRFVMVSTDKAVNPTNVMGASKRICEMYVQTYHGLGKTRFVTTRFGNVLGSNGSVVQRFKHQIETGGPVTITHPEIRRYFMTIPEACQLVLEAGTTGEGGEIFVFDMGRAEKILDLAQKMILLSGYVPGQDVHIVYTGLRPGEKLYEELLANEENTVPTHHPKILRAKVRECDALSTRQEIESLLEALPTLNDFEIVSRMKRLVPEFQSRNSRFQALDHQ